MCLRRDSILGALGLAVSMYVRSFEVIGTMNGAACRSVAARGQFRNLVERSQKGSLLNTITLPRSDLMLDL